MSDDIEALEEVDALYERKHVSNGRFRSGRRYAEAAIARQRKPNIGKMMKAARQRKVPITLAGTARQSSSEGSSE